MIIYNTCYKCFIVVVSIFVYLSQESLFSDGGRRSEIAAIREMLDTGGRDMPGSVYSAAAALLSFLSSLAEPVVPVSLHPRCIEAANNPLLCRQVRVWCVRSVLCDCVCDVCAQILPQMPAVHRHTFVYLITFMKSLLDYSFSNGLEPKVLGKKFVILYFTTLAHSSVVKTSIILNIEAVENKLITSKISNFM